MRAWLLVAVSATAVSGIAGCSATHPSVDASVDAPACEGAIPLCVFWHGECCDDVGFQATCREATWTCDPCVLDESHCSRPAGLLSACTRSVREAVRMGIDLEEYCGPADDGG